MLEGDFAKQFHHLPPAKAELIDRGGFERPAIATPRCP